MAGYKQSTQLNEKDTLQDVLNSEKEVVKMYSTAITESTGAKVRSVFKSGFDGATTDQYGIFKLMQSNGYYEPAPADKVIIDKQKDAFKKVGESLAK